MNYAIRLCAVRNQLYAWIAVVLAFAAQANSAFAAEKENARGARVIAEFDTRAYGDFLLVPVKLAGEERLFFLDTGSGVTILDSALKRHLGARIGAIADFATPSGTIDLPAFRAPAASLGSLAFDPRMVVGCYDIEVFRRTMRMDVRGILGSDFLHNRVVQIDFDGARLRFLSEPEQDAGTEIPIRFSRSLQPYCRCTAGNTEEDFLIDTGRAGLIPPVSLREDLFRELARPARVSNSDVGEPPLVVKGTWSAFSMTGAVTGEYGRLARLRVGPIEARGINVSSRRHSTLGVGFLSQYLVTMDFPRHKLYLKKTADDLGENRTGIELRRDNGVTLVCYVEPGSIGEAARIKIEDEVLAVGAQIAKEASLFSLRKLLRNNGAEVSITVVRNGSPLRILLREADKDGSRFLKKWGKIEREGRRTQRPTKRDGE